MKRFKDLALGKIQDDGEPAKWAFDDADADAVVTRVQDIGPVYNVVLHCTE